MKMVERTGVRIAPFDKEGNPTGETLDMDQVGGEYAGGRPSLTVDTDAEPHNMPPSSAHSTPTRGPVKAPGVPMDMSSVPMPFITNEGGVSTVEQSSGAATPQQSRHQSRDSSCIIDPDGQAMARFPQHLVPGAPPMPNDLTPPQRRPSNKGGLIGVDEGLLMAQQLLGQAVEGGERGNGQGRSPKATNNGADSDSDGEHDTMGESLSALTPTADRLKRLQKLGNLANPQHNNLSATVSQTDTIETDACMSTLDSTISKGDVNLASLGSNSSGSTQPSMRDSDGAAMAQAMREAREKVEAENAHGAALFDDSGATQALPSEGGGDGGPRTAAAEGAMFGGLTTPTAKGSPTSKGRQIGGGSVGVGAGNGNGNGTGTGGGAPTELQMNAPRGKFDMKRLAMESKHTWAVGTGIFVGGTICVFAAFSFAAQSLLAPVESLQFVTNIFFGRYFLDEPITMRAMFATFLIILGNVVAAVTHASSPHCAGPNDAEGLIDLYKYNTAYQLFSAFLVVLWVGMQVTYKRYQAAAKEGKSLWKHKLIEPLTFSLSSSIIGAQSVLQVKCISELLVVSATGDQQMTHWFFYVVFALWIATVVFWLYRMDLGLKLYTPLFIIPALQVNFMLFVIMQGGIFFEEFSGWAWYKYVSFGLGVFINFVGVTMLAPAAEGA